jgi:hypothetical protein
MKRSLRLLGAVIAGYVVMALIVILGVMAAAKLLVPAGEGPGSDYLVANVGISFLAAAVGGYLAARVGKADGKLAALVLAIIVLALGLILESGQGQPGWYAASIPWIGAAGVIAGGVAHILLRRRTAV